MMLLMNENNNKKVTSKNVFPRVQMLCENSIDVFVGSLY